MFVVDCRGEVRGHGPLGGAASPLTQFSLTAAAVTPDVVL